MKRLVGYDLDEYMQKNPGASAGSYFGNGEKSQIKVNRMHHSTVSIDDDSLSFSEARSEAAETAKNAGYEAFGMIPHHYRITDEAKSELHEMYDVSTEGGFWKALIENHKSDWFEFVEEGLHFHVIGSVGKKFTEDSWMKNGKEVGGENVVVEHIRDLPKVEDLNTAWEYVMSHATPPEGRHYATWYGGISYQKFSPEDLSAISMEVMEDVISIDEDKEEKECHACENEEIEPIWEAQSFINQTSESIRFRTSLDIAIEATLGENDPPTTHADLFEYLELEEALEDTEQMNLEGESATEDMRWIEP
jgi:hypothetical protein